MQSYVSSHQSCVPAQFSSQPHLSRANTAHCAAKAVLHHLVDRAQDRCVPFAVAKKILALSHLTTPSAGCRDPQMCHALPGACMSTLPCIVSACKPHLSNNKDRMSFKRYTFIHFGYPNLSQATKPQRSPTSEEASYAKIGKRGRCMHSHSISLLKQVALALLLLVAARTAVIQEGCAGLRRRSCCRSCSGVRPTPAALYYSGCAHHRRPKLHT